MSSRELTETSQGYEKHLVSVNRNKIPRRVYLLSLEAQEGGDDLSEWTTAGRIWRRSLHGQPLRPSTNISSDIRVQAD